MTNNQLTREKVQWLHDAAEEAAAVGIKLTMNPNELLMFTSALLAAMDSEPYGFTDGDRRGMIYEPQYADRLNEPLPVYRHAQPAPVVQMVSEEPPEHLLPKGNSRDVTYRRGAIILGWKLYRAAMLQSRCSIQPAPALDFEPKTAESRCGNSPLIPDCWCRNCRPLVLNDMRFVVCPDCGNKRCPKANDHRNDCSGSNEPGQEGSAYPAAPQEVQGE